MTPEQIQHIIFTVIWLVGGIGGLWISIALGAAASALGIAHSANRDFDLFAKRSAASMLWIVAGWIVGIGWFAFSLIRAVLHVVEIFT